MSDRGMKKWNAYKALTEHFPAVNNKIDSTHLCEKPIISSEEAEIINEILMTYQGQMLKIKYYRDGRIYTIETQISKIDPSSRSLILPDRERIYFKEIVGLKYSNDFDF